MFSGRNKNNSCGNPHLTGSMYQILFSGKSKKMLFICNPLLFVNNITVKWENEIDKGTVYKIPGNKGNKKLIQKLYV